MLEPWIMAHNPEEKIALFLYQKKPHPKKAAHIHANSLNGSRVKELVLNPISIIPNGIDLRK
jgi:hypothetical protein